MALTITGLSKTYPNGVRAINNLSLSIGNNMFGLVGPNGAGKSSLMRTVATLQEPDSGSIDLDGIDVLRQKDQVRRILGYLPQEFGVYPKISAQDTLYHLAVLKGITSATERKETVDALLQQTNLWEVRKKSLSTYSGGMKQRFGIAQALLGNPRLIIVDEPTAGLDPAERNRFLNLLSSVGRDASSSFLPTSWTTYASSAPGWRLSPPASSCWRVLRTKRLAHSTAGSGQRWWVPTTSYTPSKPSSM